MRFNKEELEYRIDGRRANECRKIKLECYGDNGNSTVSLSQGLTTVKVTSVQNNSSDPISVEFVDSEILSDRKIFEYKNKLIRLFGKYIITGNSIKMEVEVVSDDGGLFTTIVNAISLCFMYSGLSLTDFIVGVTSNENVDLCSWEQGKSAFECIFVYLNCSSKLVYLEVSGKCLEEELLGTIENSKRACEALSEYFKNEFQKLCISN